MVAAMEFGVILLLDALTTCSFFSAMNHELSTMNFFYNKRNYLNLTVVKEHQTLNILLGN